VQQQHSGSKLNVTVLPSLIFHYNHCKYKGIISPLQLNRDWVEAACWRFQLYHSKEEAYWTSRLERDGCG